MTLECRIFRPSKSGKLNLVETKTHEEILKTSKNSHSFNVRPRRKQKYLAWKKNAEGKEKKAK